MKSPKYIAITSGALLINEFEQLLPILSQPGIQEALFIESKENRLMKVKTEAARKRIITEVKRRIAFLPENFWSFYSGCDFDQRRILLFFIVLRNYEVTKDFQFEVVLQKWKRLETSLDTLDLKMRMDELASKNEEIGSWSESTQLKVVTVFLRCLREAGFLKNGRLIKPADQPSWFWGYFHQIDEAWFLEACLLSKTEREQIL